MPRILVIDTSRWLRSVLRVQLEGRGQPALQENGEARMFQATNTPATSAGEGSLPERRAWVRYPCTLEASCRLLANTCTVWVRDISTHRVKLLLNRGIEPGTLISVQVLARAGWVRHLLVARVLQAMVLPGSGWFIGCAWVYPLGENVLRTLASGPA